MLLMPNKPSHSWPASPRPTPIGGGDWKVTSALGHAAQRGLWLASRGGSDKGGEGGLTGDASALMMPGNIPQQINGLLPSGHSITPITILTFALVTTQRK